MATILKEDQVPQNIFFFKMQSLKIILKLYITLPMFKF